MIRRKSRNRLKLFNYGGAISSHLLLVDTANIKAIDFFESFDEKLLDGTSRKYIDKFKAKLIAEGISDVITMSDDRMIYIGNKLMIKFPEAKIYYGLNDWVVAYEYLIRFYDKNVNRIDDLIRFMNLYIGGTFAELEQVSGAEIEELTTLGDSLLPNAFDYEEIIPKFVFDALSKGFKPSEKQSKKVSEAKTDSIFNKIFEALEI